MSTVYHKQFPEYKLVWSDEFDGSGLPDPSNWTAEKWMPGVVKQEEQYYDEDERTLSVSGSCLTIRAYKADDGSWHSGRIKTRGKHFWKYGLFEARIKLPDGMGVWPAFWMMPNESVYGAWPRSGELDIMEFSPGCFGNDVYATVHHSVSMEEAKTDDVVTMGRVTLDDPVEDFHVYALMWDPDHAQAFVDGKPLSSPYYRKSAGDIAQWPFDQPFHIILNLAMGGTLGRIIDPLLTEAEFKIDWVRVYQK